MSELRILSLLPAATEMVYALGLGDALVGVSHECDFPLEAKLKAIVVKPVLALEQMTLREIDVAVAERIGSGQSLYAVDEPLVLPTGRKVRLLLTANDVIHSWWVPQLGVKQDAIPGFLRDAWFMVDTPGIYRGQCSELCGKDHGFMPIVVDVRSPADYARWRDARLKQAAAAADDPAKVWPLAALRQRGETVYSQNCLPCHQASGKGIPGNFPALDGSPVVNGDKAAHLRIVFYGSQRNPAMQAWGKQLSDTDIAAVITFERNAWGNHTGQLVQPAEVHALRGSGG